MKVAYSLEFLVMKVRHLNPFLIRSLLICSGSGYVEEVGASVTTAKKGDAVLLSFDSCKDGACYHCKDGHPAYCVDFNLLNYAGEPDIYRGKSEKGYGGKLFGQSTFASYAVVAANSVVSVAEIVKSEEELKLFAPLGCGIQTGAGAVLRIAGAGAKDTITVTGLGGVGLSAIMVSLPVGALVSPC
jgi:Zn-dependent alcohol dehydrogenase